jgi:hypothetical protein
MGPPDDEVNHLERLRRILLLLVLMGLLGGAAELLVIAHWESPWQWSPLILFALALPALAWLALGRRKNAVRAWQGLMILFLLSGFVGLGLHWNGKVEFKKETDPSLRGTRLFWEAMKSVSPPALAPAMMTYLGLLGLACTFRHPALDSPTIPENQNSGEKK